MQLVGSFRFASLLSIRIIPEVPLVMGAAVVLSVLPIIGPPLITLEIFLPKPPIASIKLSTGVPILTRKLARFSSVLPVIVTTLSNSGLLF
jgi:hypothetical protein